MSRPTPPGLPMRKEMLARTRDLLTPLDIAVGRIDLHYLDGGIDLDIFVAGKWAEPGHLTMASVASQGKSASDIPAAAPLPDVKLLAATLAVRKVRIFVSAPVA